MKIRFFKYPGSKFFLIDRFKAWETIAQQKGSRVYVEPFLGSGSIFFNSNSHWDSQHINIWEPQIWEVYNSFKLEVTWESIIEHKEFVLKNHNFLNKKLSIDDRKKIWYNFRNWVNCNPPGWNKQIFTWFLFNTCINALIRFGPRGFNSASGSGNILNIKKEQFFIIKSKLERANIYNLNWDVFLNQFSDTKDVFMFLDPPYVQNVYKESGFNRSKFISFLNNTNSNYIYTDNLHDDNMHISHDSIRSYMSISPTPTNKKTEIKNTEYVFSNFINFKKNTLI